MPTAVIGNKSCFYQDVGKGYPILLGHSYLWTSDMWEPQLKLLSQEFRCIAVDLWSHGQSGCLDATHYTVEQLAEDYWSLMQHLGISQFAVVGLSVGGMWGAHLALQHPHAVSALVLMNTFVGSEPEVTRQKYFAILDHIEKEGRFTDQILKQIVPLFFSPHTFASNPQLIADFRQDLSAIKKERIPGIVTLGRAIFSRTCLLQQLRTLAQPTLVLVGRDDIPRPPREAEEMAHHLPRAKLRIVERAGHISNLEQPDLVHSVLTEFLKECLQLRMN